VNFSPSFQFRIGCFAVHNLR